MRTVEEIQAQIDDLRAADDADSWTLANRDGMIDGFEAGLELLAQGQNSLDIARGAYVDERAYRSWGDDYADARQIGYTCALYWVGEQYDWLPDGKAVWRENNLFGFIGGDHVLSP